jgi:hypothetical protein
LEPHRQKGKGGSLLMLSVRIPKRNSVDNTKMNLREVGRKDIIAIIDFKVII